LSLLGFLSGIAMSTLVHSLGFRVFDDINAPTLSTTTLLSGVVLAPIIETAIILFVFHLFRTRFSRKPSSYVAAFTLISLHALVSPAWAVIVTIPFIVFTHPFRSDGITVKHAYWLSTISHALSNAYSFVLQGLLSAL